MFFNDGSRRLCKKKGEKIKSEEKDLKKFLDNSLETFDKVYSGDRPGFLDGYKSLKELIKPWGS